VIKGRLHISKGATKRLTFLKFYDILIRGNKKGGCDMIACAQCGKKNKNDATVCKYCGYNPSALQASTMSWGYQNGAYIPMQYQQPMRQGKQYYYDANGNAYSVQYDYKVTPVDEDDEEYEEDNGEQQMLLYPYNPTLVAQQTEETQPEEKNLMAWIGYILALFFDILAWPFCIIGLAIAAKRDDAKRDLCIGGMLFTLLRLLTAGCLFLVWWGVSTYLPEFFIGASPLEMAFAKIILFGWPVAIGSTFMELSAEGTAGKAAGKGYFYFSLVIAIAGIIFFDMTWLPIFS
jgi:hypothetical protein